MAALPSDLRRNPCRPNLVGADAQLTIFKGNIADIHAIKDTLSNHDAGATGTVTLASQIISGAGGIP
ncbi:hypothetical protein BGZ88_002038 [Linnemannia elongata]|nr:hypothetical protein BGZ88_002038 [Linnemannia elongata]